MNIIEEKYYYSEDREYWAAQLKHTKQTLHAGCQTLQELSAAEKGESLAAASDAVTEVLSQLLPLPEKFCTVVDPIQYNNFCALVSESKVIAQTLRMNLMIYQTDLSGCISFAAEELTCYPEHREIFAKLNATANELHITTSVDTGEGHATDVNGGIRMEYWFSFYKQAQFEQQTR